MPGLLLQACSGLTWADNPVSLQGGDKRPVASVTGAHSWWLAYLLREVCAPPAHQGYRPGGQVMLYAKEVGNGSYELRDRPHLPAPRFIIAGVVAASAAEPLLLEGVCV